MLERRIWFPSSSYREAAEGEDLTVAEQHGRVVAARRHLNAGPGQRLDQGGRTPSREHTTTTPPPPLAGTAGLSRVRMPCYCVRQRRLTGVYPGPYLELTSPCPSCPCWP